MDDIANDFFVQNVDALEDCLIEFAPRLVACLPVQFLRALEKLEEGLDEGGSWGEVRDYVLELRFEFSATPCEIAQLGFQARGV